MTSVYGSNMNLLQYIRDSRPELALRLHGIDMTWPISDNDLVERFEQEIVTLKADGSNVRLAIFDAISSVPAVRLPWERVRRGSAAAADVRSWSRSAAGMTSSRWSTAHMRSGRSSSTCPKRSLMLSCVALI